MSSNEFSPVENQKRGLKSKFKRAFPFIVSLKRWYETKWLPKHNPKKLAGMMYKSAMGCKMNWNNPKDLNAKIQWLKFYGDRALWSRCADKYAVRSYVEERGLGNILVKFYGKWDRAEDIDWDVLPNSFVLKLNTGSGGNYFCKDKSLLDKEDVINKFNKWMSQEFSDLYVEPHYRDIIPCIIAEELLDPTKQDIESVSLIDYKVWAFNGKPLYTWVTHNRISHGEAQVAVYDMEWKERPEKSCFTKNFPQSRIPVPKPKCFDEMMDAASRLSIGHPEVRVDFYVIDGKCYFGEMTFTSLGGYMDFYSREMLDEMGEMTDLSVVKKII